MKSAKFLKKIVIAIDGPAASGKSTTSKLTAERLGYLHIDTGAMYRAVTLKALESGLSTDNQEAIGLLAEECSIELRRDHDQLRVLLDNRDVTDAIRNQDVTLAVSAVSSIPRVREVMVREQRRLGREGGVVLEGRDIGTVVFPDADLKIYMIANDDERAIRRQRQLREQGIDVARDQLRREIVERDRYDSNRKVSPLCKAEDAVILDTSDLTIDEQVEFIVKRAKELLNR